MIFDRAYADSYEAERAGKPGWLAEHAAVAEMLGPGPVLDCPCGTGRFFDLYRERGLAWTGIDSSTAMLARAAMRSNGEGVGVGDLLAGLPFPDRFYGSAVCIRLLPWLKPHQLPVAIRELGRLAGVVVVSIRVGTPGVRCRRGSVTHSWKDFRAACSAAGLKHTHVRDTADTEVGQFLVAKLEPAP
jgi:SAM-dependent methyltransferase